MKPLLIATQTFTKDSASEPNTPNTDFDPAKTAYVDVGNGTANGVVGNPDKPFATLSQAATAVNDGGAVVLVRYTTPQSLDELDGINKTIYLYSAASNSGRLSLEVLSSGTVIIEGVNTSTIQAGPGSTVTVINSNIETAIPDGGNLTLTNCVTGTLSVVNSSIIVLNGGRVTDSFDSVEEQEVTFNELPQIKTTIDSNFTVIGTYINSDGNIVPGDASGQREQLGLAIGVDVQPYAPNTVSLDGEQTWTAAQTFSEDVTFSSDLIGSVAFQDQITFNSGLRLQDDIDIGTESYGIIGGTGSIFTVNTQGCNLPAGTNIGGQSPLTSNLLGLTVQAYDTDTAKLDGEQTWTAEQKFEAKISATELEIRAGDGVTAGATYIGIGSGIATDGTIQTSGNIIAGGFISQIGNNVLDVSSIGVSVQAYDANTVKSNTTQGGTGSLSLNNIVVISEADYAALDPKDPNTLYLRHA